MSAKDPKKNIILMVSAVLIIAFLSLGTLILPDREKSDNENRYLEQAPDFDIGDILSGEFEEDSEKYLTDQIIGREQWISMYSNILKAGLRKDINGVYLLKDGVLAERNTAWEFDWSTFRGNLDNVALLRSDLEGRIPVDVMLVPSASFANRAAYNMSTNFDEYRCFSHAEDALGDGLIILRGQMEPDMYYKTDHHWNMKGAMNAASIYLARAGLKVDLPELVTVSGGFRGTLYSKILMNGDVTDAIQLPAGWEEDRTKLIADGEEFDSIYFGDRLDQKDQYEVYLGGNYGKADIIPENGEGKPSLLIVKDSYANSFVPAILSDFSRITLIDPRYYRGSVEDLAKMEGYDRVLVLFSTVNFSQQKLELTKSLLG